MKEITVEIVYAQPQQQTIFSVKLPEGSTVYQAIQASTILQQFPVINLEKNKVGIFGKLVKLNALVNNNDRIEIYRPLIIDPKEARRKKMLQPKTS